MTGRQVTSAGNFTNVFQGNGSASFDGENSVTITQTTDTILAVGAPATWTGSYSVQANCTGVITITSGASVTLNLAIYDQGVDFLVSGNDAIYAYSGSGNTAPANCSAATLSGVYTFTATGYSLASGSVTGEEDATGLLQFDGVSVLTANLNTALLGKSPIALTLTGSYSISSNCLGSATLTDSTKTNTYVVSFSVSSSAVATGSFSVTLTQSGKLVISGTGNAAYGQPTATAEVHREVRPAAAFARLWFKAADVSKNDGWKI